MNIKDFEKEGFEILDTETKTLGYNGFTGSLCWENKHGNIETSEPTKPSKTEKALSKRCKLVFCPFNENNFNEIRLRSFDEINTFLTVLGLDKMKLSKKRFLWNCLYFILGGLAAYLLF